jgi:hypothetical protein
MIPMNLQFFSENDPQVDPPKSPVDNPEAKKQEDPAEHEPDPDGKHTYTDEQVNEIVKKRLARAEKEKQAAVDEAAKLAKMNADQKKDYELQKAQKERDELKSQLATYEMGKQARSMFEDAKLSVTEDDLKHVVTSEAESTETNVKWLIAHDQAVAERIRQELLKGSTPRVHGQSNKTVDKATFDQMTAAERVQLAKDDPEQFNKITGGY